MSLRSVVKRAAIGAASSIRMLPHGVNLAADLRREMASLKIGLVFDVGANVGQSIAEFSSAFPGCKIFSFEPDPATFQTLKSTYGNRAEVFQFAFSDTAGHLHFDNSSPVSEIHGIADNQSNTSLPLVDVTTVDDFCGARKIDHVSLLKIDTEGHDLHIIRGAARMLKERRIDVISAECSISQRSERLVSFTGLQDTMRELGYVCFGIYNQAFNWGGERREISWANVAFVSSGL